MQSLASRREGWSWAMGEEINARSWPTVPTRHSFVLSAGQQVRVAFSLGVLFLVCCPPQGCTFWLSGLTRSDFVPQNLSVCHFLSFPPLISFLAFPVFDFPLSCPPPRFFSLVSFQDISLYFISLWPLTFSYFSFAWALSVYCSLYRFFSLSSTLHLSVSVFLSLYSFPSPSSRKVVWYFIQ